MDGMHISGGISGTVTKSRPTSNCTFHNSQISNKAKQRNFLEVRTDKRESIREVLPPSLLDNFLLRIDWDAANISLISQHWGHSLLTAFHFEITSWFQEYSCFSQCSLQRLPLQFKAKSPIQVLYFQSSLAVTHWSYPLLPYWPSCFLPSKSCLTRLASLQYLTTSLYRPYIPCSA